MRLTTSSRKARCPDSTTPEEVLLQITLAFMVFLGFLLSNQVESQASIGKRMEDVNNLVQSLTNTGENILIKRSLDYHIEIEKLKLLNQWEELKRTNRFFSRIMDFHRSNSRGESGPLADLGLNALLANSRFQDLRTETTRLYLPGKTRGSVQKSMTNRLNALSNVCVAPV